MIEEGEDRVVKQDTIDLDHAVDPGGSTPIVDLKVRENQGVLGLLRNLVSLIEVITQNLSQDLSLGRVQSLGPLEKVILFHPVSKVVSTPL